MAMVSDALLIQRLNARDESVLEDIRSMYGNLCFQMAFRILENREDAEECVNDMLLSVWDSIPPKLPVSLQAYLITIVRNTALDKMRRIQSQKRGCIEFSLALDELAEILPSGEQIEKTVEQRELMQMLRTFLATIKPESYQLFMERYYLAKSVQAIAESHQISEAKVKVTLLRIRRKLKDYLRKEGLL
jgi:RNA polymerase sigma-70 factor (ECF subfamily)